MASFNVLYYQSYVADKDYDIRKSRNARWIDQKCTYDVIASVATCIYYREMDEFTVRDIMYSSYAQHIIEQDFKKPDMNEKSAKSEYDKFFGQPIKLLENAGILSSEKVGNTFVYTVKEVELLELLQNENEALQFLNIYIEKVLRDSGLYPIFLEFCREQTKESLGNLKDTFASFTIENTNINGTLECNRIFPKILNPISFRENKKGVIAGRLSKEIITKVNLQYNQKNFKDKDKPKNITRQTYNELYSEKYGQEDKLKNIMDKMKKEVKSYNELYNQGKPELIMEEEMHCVDTVAHHIFPINEKPELMGIPENLICVSPNQHYNYLHPKNHTSRVDKYYQYLCLLSKLNVLETCIFNKRGKLYNFDRYTDMLNKGLNTDIFDIKMNYDEVRGYLYNYYIKYVLDNENTII